MLYELEKTLLQLRELKPLILCLTNHVTMDFMANSLLSLGAAPIMSEEERELEELIHICQAININIGTLDEAFIRRTELTIRFAKQAHKPIVLDPVGAGATKIRTTTARLLLESADIIRGNASEIMALDDLSAQTLGVESTRPVSHATESAIRLAKQYQCTVVVSGEIDFVTDGEQNIHLAYGSRLMPLVTGMGCTLTAVIAAFRATTPLAFKAAHLATAYFGLCGALAEQKSSYPGSFRTSFIDELYRANITDMREMPHVV